MQKLADEMIFYIRFLEKEYGLEISLCDLHERIFPYSNLLTPYHTHRNHSCVLLKIYDSEQKVCIHWQKLVRKKCLHADHFYGVCHAGMGEYIFRIMHRETYLGFISVSGYCQEPHKAHGRMRRICDRHGVPYASLSFLFETSTNRPLPEFERLRALVLPLQKMCELFYIAVLSEEEGKISPPDALLNALQVYLADNFTNPLTLDEISRRLHYSKSYLCHYFYAKKGMGIMQYVNGMRIELAKKLLRDDSFSVAEIAFQVGFNDANYFTNCFRKREGVSPTQYRKSQHLL